MAKTISRTGREQALDDTVNALYRTLMEEGQWPAALASLGALFEAPRLGLIYATPDMGEVLGVQALNHDPESQRLYQARYFQLDPAHELVARVKVGQWFDSGHLLNPQRKVHGEYVNDYARKHGYRWASGGRVHAGAYGTTIFSVQRAADQGNFDAHSQQLFAQLMPHLERVSALGAEMQRLRVHRALGLAALDGFDWPAFVVRQPAARGIRIDRKPVRRRLPARRWSQPERDRLRPPGLRGHSAHADARHLRQGRRTPPGRAGPGAVRPAPAVRRWCRGHRPTRRYTSVTKKSALVTLPTPPTKVAISIVANSTWLAAAPLPSAS